MYPQWNIIQPQKRKEILPFETTWTNLEGIMLREINQRKTNTACFHLYSESKDVELIEGESRMVAVRVGWRAEGMGRYWLMVQIPSHKMNML